MEETKVEHSQRRERMLPISTIQASLVKWVFREMQNNCYSQSMTKSMNFGRVLSLLALLAALGGFQLLSASPSGATTPPTITTYGPVPAPSGGSTPNFWGIAVSPTSGNSYYVDYSNNNALWVLPAGQTQMTEIMTEATLNTICGNVGNQYMYQLTWSNGKIYFGCGGYIAKIFTIPDTTTSVLSPSDITTVFTASNAGAGCNIIGHDGSDTNGSVFGVVLDASGNMWFTDDYETQNLYEVPAGTTDGSCRVFSDVGGAAYTPGYLNWITIGDSGNIYLTADAGHTSNQIVEFQPSTGSSSIYLSNICTDPSGGGTEQLISPPGLHDALFLNCQGGSTYVVPQNSDGTAGSPVAVADLSSQGSFGLAGFCNGMLWETGLGASVYSVTPIPSDLCVPQGVTAAASGTTATVSWTSIPYGVTSYTATASTGQTCTATAPATSCTITGLAPGTAVTFTVTATYPTGTSAPSDPSSPVTPTSSDSGGSSAPAKLASTGFDGGQLVLIGLLLSVGGLGGMLVQRRRRAFH